VKTVNFCYNPTGWDNSRGRPVPGGMTDCLVQPILPHLETPFVLSNQPQQGMVNVYYSHRRKYGVSGRLFAERAVFVSHGIGDKNWRNGSRVSKHFDYIFVSGPAWTTKMIAERVPSTQIVEVGYAKLDPVAQGSLLRPPLSPQVRVVYAPTHGGGGEHSHGMPGDPTSQASRLSSHHSRSSVLELLNDDRLNVVEALHPRHRPDGRSTLSEYVDADVVIADGGSTIYEAMALGIPVVFPDWLVADAHRHNTTFEGDVYRQQIGRHVHHPDKLVDAVLNAASQGITPAERRFVEEILPAAYIGESGRMHAEALDDIANRRPIRHRVPVEMRCWRRVTDPTRQLEVVLGSPQDMRLARNKSWEEAQ